MNIIEVVLVGLGLSMDAVAVTLSNSMASHSHKNRWLMPVFFGLFQGIMPLLGYFAGSLFANFISKYSGIVVCAILVFIGAKMIWESVRNRHEEPKALDLSIKLLLVQALATSIDAFAVGVGLSAMGVNVFLASALIAATTAACSLASIFIGRKFGALLGNKAEILGGVILIVIGIKALF